MQMSQVSDTSQTSPIEIETALLHDTFRSGNLLMAILATILMMLRVAEDGDL